MTFKTNKIQFNVSVVSENQDELKKQPKYKVGECGKCIAEEDLGVKLTASKENSFKWQAFFTLFCLYSMVWRTNKSDGSVRVEMY